MKIQDLYPGQVGLPTETMAKVINRAPQTLRKWSTYGGPLTPLRIGRRLFWKIDDAQRLLDQEGSAK